MSLKIDMKINSKAVNASLNRKRKRIRPSIKDGLNEIGEHTIKLAKTKVPVRSGDLQRSLDYAIHESRDGWILSLGSGLTGGKQLKYALIQEQGGRTGRGYSVLIKPHWYMRNSIREMQANAKSILKRHVRKGIK